jgi:hypothetical protein
LWHVLGEEAEQHPVAEWVRETEGMSIAHLKELVVAVTCLEQAEEEVIARLKTMKSAPRSTMYDSEVGFGTALIAAKQQAYEVQVQGKPARR